MLYAMLYQQAKDDSEGPEALLERAIDILHDATSLPAAAPLPPLVPGPVSAPISSPTPTPAPASASATTTKANVKKTGFFGTPIKENEDMEVQKPAKRTATATADSTTRDADSDSDSDFDFEDIRKINDGLIR